MNIFLIIKKTDVYTVKLLDVYAVIVFHMFGYFRQNRVLMHCDVISFRPTLCQITTL